MNLTEGALEIDAPEKPAFVSPGCWYTGAG